MTAAPSAEAMQACLQHNVSISNNEAALRVCAGQKAHREKQAAERFEAYSDSQLEAVGSSSIHQLQFGPPAPSGA